MKINDKEILKKKHEHNSIWKYINSSSYIVMTGPLTKWCSAEPVMSRYNILKKSFLANILRVVFFLQFSKHEKILNMTALYDYTHNLATMFVCESALETGLCQVLHTKRTLTITGRAVP